MCIISAMCHKDSAAAVQVPSELGFKFECLLVQISAEEPIVVVLFSTVREMQCHQATNSCRVVPSSFCIIHPRTVHYLK